jgi:hypothetical protein
MKRKCPSCNSCLDYNWIGPNMVLHCWLENTYYRLISNSVVQLSYEEVDNMRKNGKEYIALGSHEPKQSI